MRILIALVASFLVLSPVFAQKKPASNSAAEQPKKGKDKQGMGKPLAQFGDWAVFSGQTPNGKVCYAASQPQETTPKGIKRDPAYIFITTNPSKKIKDDFSLKNGYPMKKESDATLKIDKDSYPLFTKEEGAWVKTASDEPKIISSMKEEMSLTIKASSAKGREITDTYSLKGLSQALEKVASECK